MSYINNSTFNNFQAPASADKIKQTNNEEVLPFNGHSLIKAINIPILHIVNNLNTKEKTHLASNEYDPQVNHKVTILNSENHRLKCISTGCFFAISETEYKLEKAQANNIIDGPDMHIARYPCPYLATQFKDQSSEELLNQGALEKIRALIYNTMRQQNIIFEQKVEVTQKNSNTCLHFFPDQTYKNGVDKGLIYNITFYTKRSIKASAAITELWKEVETDKLIIKLGMLYPNIFDKKSNIYIETWHINVDQTIYLIIKNNDTKHEIPIHTFIDINQFSINFDQLRDNLTKLDVPYKKLFLPAQKTLKSKFSKPKIDIPSGILYTNIFTIFH